MCQWLWWGRLVDDGDVNHVKSTRKEENEIQGEKPQNLNEIQGEKHEIQGEKPQNLNYLLILLPN